MSVLFNVGSPFQFNACVSEFEQLINFEGHPLLKDKIR